MAQKLEDLHVAEVSLVKRGANGRTWLLRKSGTVEFDETIAKILDAPAEDEAALLEAVQKAGGDDEVLLAVSALARIREALPAEVLKAMDAMQDDMDDENANGKGDEEKPDEDKDEDELAKSYETLLKRQFSADDRKKLSDSGAAMSNGSYPIENADDLKNAIHAVGRGSAPHAEIRAHIEARAKALGAEDQLPESWKVSKEDDMTETAQAVPVKKDDGSWDLSSVPEEQHAAVEAVIKAQEDERAELLKKAADNESRAEAAERIAKSVEAKLEKAEHVEAAKGYSNLAKSADEIGELLYDIAKAEQDEHLPKGTSETLTELLKAANEAAKDVFKEAGRTGASHGGADLESKVKAKADEIRKADPDLTEAQAIAKAYEQNPALYDEYLKEVA